MSGDVVSHLGRADVARLKVIVDHRFQLALKTIPATVEAEPTVNNVEPDKPKKLGGPPKRYNEKDDQRIFDAWQSGRYRDKLELANEFRKSKKEIEKAIDRHRKRHPLSE